MRNRGVFSLLFLVAAAALLSVSSNVDCKATIEKIKEDAAAKESGGSESWAEWAEDKLSEGLGFKSADNQENSKRLTADQNSDEAGCPKNSAKGKACELAEEAKEKAWEAYEKTREAKDRVVEKVLGKEVAEESKKREAEVEDSLAWAKEKLKEEYDAAKVKAEEMYKSGKDKLRLDQEL